MYNVQASYKSYYYLAIFIGAVLHGSLLFFTHGQTYDAYVHMFFAKHYAGNWFESWNYQWYTGFTITSYPPLVHQYIALASKVIGLKLGFISWGVLITMAFIRGVYQYSRLFVSDKAAVYAAFAAAFSFSFVEALHVFGQLPSITGITFVLNACPEIYKYFRHQKAKYLFTSLTLLAATTGAHHVSTIFGAVFFVAPVMSIAVMDLSADKYNGIHTVGIPQFLRQVWRHLPRAIIFGLLVIAIVVLVVFPYWYWSKTDPISQVSIPHGSRGNFIADPNLGLVFFLIPWGLMAFLLPYFFFRMFQKRTIFMGLSFSLAVLLGTGGTTPLPRLLLGANAFDILTLDRFTFWATLMALPFWGEFLFRFVEGDFAKRITRVAGRLVHKITLAILGALIIGATILIVNVGFFRPLQPKAIDPKPITKFLNSDNHDQWRFLTLGFGDQIAWLSANTDALSVDGNYHSARRLPELTTRAVERIENSKYLGLEGLGALQQFLTDPEKYHLKYVFSNDKYYAPVLHFLGWQKITQLENHIVVWEKPDVEPLPKLLPKKTIPTYQRIIWGTLPLFSLLLMLITVIYVKYTESKHIVNSKTTGHVEKIKESKVVFRLTALFCFISGLSLIGWIIISAHSRGEQATPENTLKAYYQHLDFRRFQEAYDLLIPERKPSFSQYMLDLSIEDGITASYAKLDSLELLSVTDLEENQIQVDAKAHWLTSVMSYQTEHTHMLQKRENKWFIDHVSYESFTPPERMTSQANIEFLSQGRRRAIVDQTDQSDVMDRPTVEVLSSSLVENEGYYYIIGEIINTDNFPAYLTVESTMYDQQNNPILTANTADAIIHHIRPKERTPFKIDFNSNAVQKIKSNSEFEFQAGDNPFSFMDKPSSFSLAVKSLATDYNFYSTIGIQHLKVTDNFINGEIRNSGVRQINIPQVLIAHYDKGRMYWLDKQYQENGIRPKRKKAFAFELHKQDINVIQHANESNVIVNGSRQQNVREVDTGENTIKLFINPFVYE